MNAAWVMVFSVLYFAAAYVFYGRFLKKVFGIDNSRPCPSHELNDGIDYVPTPMPVLFGHHFASIAGAGPIVGPVLAAQFGWLPALLWITIGCVFIGAMHDFSAMFLSVRNKGRSIASVIENELGYAGRQLFLLFCFAALILVVTVFTTMVADSFLSTPCVATSSLLFIGMAPLFGVAVNRKILSLAEGSLIFVPLLFCCIWGHHHTHRSEYHSWLPGGRPRRLDYRPAVLLPLCLGHSGLGTAAAARLPEFISALCNDDSRICRNFCCPSADCHAGDCR